MPNDKLREEVMSAVHEETSSIDQHIFRSRRARIADRILSIPEIAEAISLRNAFLASRMPDLSPERVGEIMRGLNARA